MANIFEEKLQVQHIEGGQERRQLSISQDAFNRRHSLGTGGRNSLGRKSFDNANLAMVFGDKTHVEITDEDFGSDRPDIEKVKTGAFVWLVAFAA